MRVSLLIEREAMQMTKQTYVVQCVNCEKNFGIDADPSDMELWESGEGYIQDILHYLNKSQRELLISQTCGDCWGEMFGYDVNSEN